MAKFLSITQRELMADVVKVKQIGVPCGLFNKRIKPGYMLENGVVLLESEKDEQGRYIGGAGMDGMYLQLPERYKPLRGTGGKILAFCRVDPQSSLNRFKARVKRSETALR